MRTVLIPAGLEECFGLMKQHPDAVPMAGGTDLLVSLRSQSGRDDRPLISLNGVKELHGICVEGTTLVIGAATTFSRIITDGLVQQHAPLLATAARTVGGPAIRNMATIGGNILTASPAGDSLTPLYLLEAEIEITSQQGTRVQPISEFITGPGRTSLANGEVITRILLPRIASFPNQCFEKVGRRRSMAISVTTFAGLVRLSDTGIIEEARFAWGSVGPTVVRITSLEQVLVGSRLDDNLIQQAAQAVHSNVTPISDIRATADYRCIVAGNLFIRFMEGLRG